MNYKLAVRSVVDPKCANEPKTLAVKAILEKWGFDYETLVDPLWYGWPSKLTGFINIANELPECYTHLMLIDARDVILLGTPDQVMERWFKFDHSWVFNAEPFIWSPGSFEPSDYPTPDVTYRYLNSGASLGEIAHIRAWYSRWTNKGKSMPTNLPRGDQDWVAARFIEDYPHAIQLDTNCELFQCACGSRVEPDPNIELVPGEVYNRITNTRPLVIHANGGDDITTPDWRLLWETV